MFFVGSAFLPPKKRFEVELPAGAEIIKTCNRTGQPQIFFLCNSTEKTTRRFCLVDDGEEIPLKDEETLLYIGSYLSDKIYASSQHLFEVFEDE